MKLLQLPQTINAQMLERTIMHQVFISRYGAGLANRIIALLENVQIDLVAIITKRMLASNERGFDTGPMTTARYKRLFAAINETVDLHNDAAYRELRTELFVLATQEAAWQAGVVVKEMPVKVEMLLPSAEMLRSVVTSQPFRGKFLREWFAELKAAEKKNIQQALRIGVAEGEGIEAMVRRVIGTRANKYRDGVLQTTRHDARMVVRTAVNHVSTAARLHTNRENANVIKAEKIVATLDQRTSSICRTYDGKVFKLGKGPRPPFHPNCRTTVVPVLKSWRELGVNLKEAPKGTRAALGGEVPDDVTYPQWFARQKASTQREVLGSTRYKLFKSGKMDGDVLRFSDKRGRLYRLDELKAREGDAFAAIGQAAPKRKVARRVAKSEAVDLTRIYQKGDKVYTSNRIAEIMDANTDTRIDVQKIKKTLGDDSQYWGEAQVKVADLKGQRDADVDKSRAIESKGRIIVLSDGTIVDGRHRTALAASKNQETISAYVPLKRK